MFARNVAQASTTFFPTRTASWAASPNQRLSPRSGREMVVRVNETWVFSDGSSPVSRPSDQAAVITTFVVGTAGEE